MLGLKLNHISKRGYSCVQKQSAKWKAAAREWLNCAHSYSDHLRWFGLSSSWRLRWYGGFVALTALVDKKFFKMYELDVRWETLQTIVYAISLFAGIGSNTRLAKLPVLVYTKSYCLYKMASILQAIFSNVFIFRMKSVYFDSHYTGCCAHRFHWQHISHNGHMTQ